MLPPYGGRDRTVTATFTRTWSDSARRVLITFRWRSGHSWAEGQCSLGARVWKRRSSESVMVTLAKRKSFALECAAAPDHPQTGRDSPPHAGPPDLTLSPVLYFLLPLLQISTENLKHFHRHLRLLIYPLLASLAISCRGLGNPCWKVLMIQPGCGAIEPTGLDREVGGLTSGSATDLLSDPGRVTYYLWVLVFTNLEHP